MIELTREEALRRLHAARKAKQECVERETKRLVEIFESIHGEKPKCVEVWGKAIPCQFADEEWAEEMRQSEASGFVSHKDVAKGAENILRKGK